MPRQPRLDAPGVLQHVMARGIERRKIFLDDKDRASFLERLAVILEETQTQCYAWALIPNHFHLLLRTGLTSLSQVMRRLMTGYAVTFNIRHRRSGHLFQNRYKSVICEEDPYLLELIRYIHLNPLRAGLVNDLKELDKYPWSGHSVILGHRKNPLIPKLEKEVSSADKRIGFSQFHLETEKARMNPENPVKLARAKLQAKPGVPRRSFAKTGPACPVGAKHRTGVRTISLAEKTTQDVLKHFGKTLREARRRYRQFVKNGVDQGKRPEFQGGGLVRPACHARLERIWSGKKYRATNENRAIKDRVCKARAGRSAGGNKARLLGRRKEEREKGDARILGSGDFVNEALSKAGEEWKSQTGPRPSLKALINTVSEAFDLSLSSSSVSRIVESGENILLCRETAFSEKAQRSLLEDED